jgi:hypothetical protein
MDVQDKKEKGSLQAKAVGKAAICSIGSTDMQK